MTGDRGVARLLGPIRRLHEQIRDQVIGAFERCALEELATVAFEGEDDTIYAVDRMGDEHLVEYFDENVARNDPIVLVAEGLDDGGRVVLPHGASEDEARWRIIVDPIDGTRGAMYQKRSAWILTGVAPNRGARTSLADIELAIQTEIPLVKQHLSDTVWALAGRSTGAHRYNRLTGETVALELTPSRAQTIAHGFAMISRFFPGLREELAAIDEEIVRGAIGPPLPGKRIASKISTSVPADSSTS